VIRRSYETWTGAEIVRDGPLNALFDDTCLHAGIKTTTFQDICNALALTLILSACGGIRVECVRLIDVPLNGLRSNVARDQHRGHAAVPEDQPVEIWSMALLATQMTHPRKRLASLTLLVAVVR
jgi:hypothetical protein